MQLIVTSQIGLDQCLGAGGREAALLAIEGYVRAKENIGISSRVAVVDAAESMQAFGIEPIPAVSTELVALQIERIRARENSAGRAITEILLIGGDDVVPFWRLRNPVTSRAIDPDTVVLSDNPYGQCVSPNFLDPQIPVGRLWRWRKCERAARELVESH